MWGYHSLKFVITLRNPRATILWESPTSAQICPGTWAGNPGAVKRDPLPDDRAVPAVSARGAVPGRPI